MKNCWFLGTFPRAHASARKMSTSFSHSVFPPNGPPRTGQPDAPFWVGYKHPKKDLREQPFRNLLAGCLHWRFQLWRRCEEDDYRRINIICTLNIMFVFCQRDNIWCSQAYSLRMSLDPYLYRLDYFIRYMIPQVYIKSTWTNGRTPFDYLTSFISHL